MQPTEVLEHYEADNENRLAKESMRYYRTVMEEFLTFIAKPSTEVTRHDIRQWLLHLTEGGNGPNTLRAKLFGLRSFFGYCKEEEIIEEDPTDGIALPTVPDTVPHYLTREQLTRLREHTKDHPRNRAIVETLYATGVRVSELVQIRLHDINFDERIIHIHKGKGKRDRIVLFTRDCEEHIKAYLEAKEWHTPRLFLNHMGEPMGRRGVQKWFETWADDLNMKLSVHTMRHTFAAHLAQKGMPLAGIQTLLGHESVEDTLVYTKLYDYARKEQYDDYH
ncbi:integrase [Lentibacillus lipolyticus]|nr:integrase [Lentibacillus lipolyticus]